MKPQKMRLRQKLRVSIGPWLTVLHATRSWQHEANRELVHLAL